MPNLAPKAQYETDATQVSIKSLNAKGSCNVFFSTGSSQNLQFDANETKPVKLDGGKCEIHNTGTSTLQIT